MKWERGIAFFLSLAIIGWVPIAHEDKNNLTEEEISNPLGLDTTFCHEKVMHSKWTMMLYLNGDNYANSDSQNILNEAKMVGSTNEVRLLALFDGDLYGDTRLYFIEKNSLEELEWPTESDMGDKETLVIG